MAQQTIQNEGAFTKEIRDIINQNFNDLYTGTDNAADAITAKAGGVQATATALTKRINRVTTVATAADAVALPASVAGASIVIINSGANPMQVFGAGTDTINDVATATGVSQPPNSMVEYACSVAGKWYAGPNIGYAGQLPTQISASAITAGTTRTQAGATAITCDINRVDTSTAPSAGSSLGDGVKLPASAAGLDIIVHNNTANPIQVYGAGTDTVNGVAGATGIQMLPNSAILFLCAASGAWAAENAGQGFSGGLPTFSFLDGITAHAGGGQGSAKAIVTALARFTVVASAGDSAVLPASAGGLSVTVINAGASSMNVFPATGEAINALSANASFAVPVGGVCQFDCTVAGTWHTLLGTSTSTGTGAQVLQSAPTINNPVITGPAPQAGGSTLAVTTAMIGAPILLDTAAGTVATLPAATGTGNVYKFVVKTTATSNAHKILANSVSDFINGIVTGENANTAKCFASAAATNHSLQMPFAGTQPSGGFIGDWFELTDIAANLWTCKGMYQAGTTPTTPFSSATS